MSSASNSPRPRDEWAARLKRVLLDPAEAAALDVHGRIDAAVLVPLFVEDGRLHAVFTRRRDDLRNGYERQRMLRRGIPFRTDVYVVGDNLIWGATARMLTDLLERLDASGSAPGDRTGS